MMIYIEKYYLTNSIDWNKICTHETASIYQSNKSIPCISSKMRKSMTIYAVYNQLTFNQTLSMLFHLQILSD